LELEERKLGRELTEDLEGLRVERREEGDAVSGRNASKIERNEEEENETHLNSNAIIPTLQPSHQHSHSFLPKPTSLSILVCPDR